MNATIPKENEAWIFDDPESGNYTVVIKFPNRTDGVGFERHDFTVGDRESFLTMIAKLLNLYHVKKRTVCDTRHYTPEMIIQMNAEKSPTHEPNNN